MTALCLSMMILATTVLQACSRAAPEAGSARSALADSPLAFNGEMRLLLCLCCAVQPVINMRFGHVCVQCSHSVQLCLIFADHVRALLEMLQAGKVPESKELDLLRGILIQSSNTPLDLRKILDENALEVGEAPRQACLAEKMHCF